MLPKSPNPVRISVPGVRSVSGRARGCLVSLRARSPAVDQHNMPLLKLNTLDQSYKTILCMDGGGMRGLLTVSLMDGLVNVVKEELVEAARGCKDPNTYQATLDGIPYDLAGSDPAAFDIDLGDFFDVLSGTSTGSIIATYLAARGKASTGIVKQAEQQLLHLREDHAGLPEFKNLRPGSVQSGQAIFLHAADTIFKKRPTGAAVDAFLASQNFSSVLRKLPILGVIPLIPFALQMVVRGVMKLLSLALLDAVATMDKLVAPGYDSDGIKSILEQVYGDETSLSGGLETSLVVPTFQLSARTQSTQHGSSYTDPAVSGARRPFTFFYLHNKNRAPSGNGSSNGSGTERRWGYSSIARLMSAGEIGIADATQVQELSYTLKSTHRLPGLHSSSSTPSSNGTRPPNDAKALNEVTAIRSAADLVYRFGLDFALKDVVRSSAAAPTFFPPAEVSPVADTAAKGSSQASTTYVLCDGGVVANNPSAEAVAFTSIAYGQNNELVSPKDIAVLSLGTGTSIKPAMVHQEFAGQGSWLLLDGPLMEVLTGGSQELGTSLETIDMLASGQYTEGQISRIQLTCQWDQARATGLAAVQKEAEEHLIRVSGWTRLQGHLRDNNSLLASRMVPDVLLEDPYGGEGEPRLLSTILTRMDYIEDRWWLYRLGQELAACPRVQDTFRTFVRKFVLAVDKDGPDGQPAQQDHKNGARELVGAPGMTSPEP